MTNQEKKYRVPIEMDKEYAAQIGINLNEIRCIMLGGKLTSVYYVEIEDEHLYHELMRPIWREEKELERSKKCAVSNEHGKLIRCDGNCATCPHTKSGTPISIEAMEETGGFRSTQDGVHRQPDSATYTASTEDIIMDAMLLETLWHHIAELSEENRTIITMFSEGVSEREIAEAVGMSQKGVNKRKKAIFEILKNNLQDFF